MLRGNDHRRLRNHLQALLHLNRKRTTRRRGKRFLFASNIIRNSSTIISRDQSCFPRICAHLATASLLRATSNITGERKMHWSSAVSFLSTPSTVASLDLGKGAPFSQE